MLLSASASRAGAQAQGRPHAALHRHLRRRSATAIENGFKLYVAEQGGKLGGREIEYVKVDDESDPAKATDNVNKLIKRDNVDVLVGTVHSGVAMAMAKAAKDTGTLLIVPNAGADAVTGPMCAANIFRSSFSNWQPGYAMGEVVAKKGHKKVVTITWKYAAGDESVKGFKEGVREGRRQGRQGAEPAVPQRRVPGAADRDRGAQARRRVHLLRRRRRGEVRQGLRGGGPEEDDPAVRRRLPHRRHARGAGRRRRRPADHAALCATASTRRATRRSALAYVKAYKMQPDVYAVQGYDAAQMLAIGLNAVKGDISKKAEFAAAMEKATIDSPRGPFTISASRTTRCRTSTCARWRARRTR